jgi:predicted acyl esterase
LPSTSYRLDAIDLYEAQQVTFSTAPFEAPTDVVGPVALTLTFSASAIDTYFVARIDDIAPDGKRTKLSWGWLLASHRTIDSARSNPTEIVHDHSAQAARQLTPGARTTLKFSLNPIANRFRIGHRLELKIASRPELLASESGEGFDMFHWDPVPYRSRNIIEFGGTEPSCLDICIRTSMP